MLWATKTTPRFHDLLELLRTYNVHSYILSVKWYKSAKWKVHGVKSLGKQVQTCKNHLTVELNRMHLIPPVMSYDNTCKMLSTRKDHLSLDVQSFYWGGGSITQATTQACWVNSFLHRSQAWKSYHWAKIGQFEYY